MTKHELFKEYRNKIFELEHFKQCKYNGSVVPINDCSCTCYEEQIFYMGLRAEQHEDENHVLLTKEEYQNLINIKALAVEAHKRFVDYEMDVDTDAPCEHRDFMRRLKKHLRM